MSVPTLPWWVGVAPAVGVVECGGSEHRLEWRAGELHAVDHPDPAAEAALAALGGSPSTCTSVLSAWAEHSATPELITLGRRPGELGLGLPPQAVRSPVVAAGRPPFRLSPAGRERLAARERRREGLVALLSLPPPFIDRLVLSSLDAAARRWPDEDFRADHGLRVGAALSARATPSLRRLGARLTGGPVEVGVSPARSAAGAPLIVARLESAQPLALSADLPVRWLSQVWGRGLAEPDEELVLDVVSGTADGSSFEVTVAEWEPAGSVTWEAAPVPATITTDAVGTRRVRRHW